ncbi:MAG: hypothetical protein H0W07_08985 [Chloroflexi bacterium]|nr:hypothetical protein [Chloroflexota bacterium]
MLRRALLVWGLGHLAIGDGRGWLLLALQAASVAGISVLATALLESDRDILVFLAVVGYLVVWAGQAVDAHRRAELLGGAPGGAIQILVLAPAAIAALTLFWLVGGSAGSPAAVLQRYVTAWKQDQPAVGRGLFLVPPEPGELGAIWTDQSAYLAMRLTALQSSLGSGSGIDPRQPWTSLLFVPIEPASDATGTGVVVPAPDTVIGIQIVRQVTVRGSFFGLFPTASQESRPIERIGTVTLRAIAREPVLGVSRGIIWRIDTVDLPPS